MTTPDFRALCAEMLDCDDGAIFGTDLVTRAHAALAAPTPELGLLERVEALERRPIPGFVELAAPTPEAAPVATDEELCCLWANRPKMPNSSAAALRAIYDLGRQHGAAAAQPTPPAPEPGEVEELVRRLRNRDRWTQLTDAQLERAATLLQPLSAPAIPLPQAGEGEG